MASGMRHVETNTYNVKRLLHVKGKRSIRAAEVGPAPICPGPEASPPGTQEFLLPDVYLFPAGGNELGQF